MHKHGTGSRSRSKHTQREARCCEWCATDLCYRQQSTSSPRPIMWVVPESPGRGIQSLLPIVGKRWGSEDGYGDPRFTPVVGHYLQYLIRKYLPKSLLLRICFELEMFYLHMPIRQHQHYGWLSMLVHEPTTVQHQSVAITVEHLCSKPGRVKDTDILKINRTPNHKSMHTI